MKIRRYLGKDTQEAILKVKMDLGSEAVILNTKKIRQKGFFNILKKPMVEVLAAIDEYYGNTKKGIPKNNKNDKNDILLKEDSNLIKKEEKISALENKVTNMELLLNKVYEEVKLSSTQKRIIISLTNKMLKTDVLYFIIVFFILALIF